MSIKIFFEFIEYFVLIYVSVVKGILPAAGFAGFFTPVTA